MPWLPDLQSLLPDRVSISAADLERCAADKWFASQQPEAVVFATGAHDVSAVMKFSARHGVPVTVRGGGVGYVGGCVPVRGGIVISLEQMNRIIEISPT